MGSDAQGIVSNLINGLQLVRSITGLINGSSRPTDQAYQNSVNVAATITGLVSATQGGVQQRSSAFMQGGNQIGSAPDLKGSIDQNTQVQIQTGQTVNELTGVVNTRDRTNQANLDRLAGGFRRRECHDLSPVQCDQHPGWGRTMIGRLALAIGVVVFLGACGHRPLKAPCEPGDAQPLSHSSCRSAGGARSADPARN